GEVACGEEVVRGDREEDEQDEEAEDRRERPELAAADASDVVLDRAADRALGRVDREVGGRGREGRRRGSRSVGRRRVSGAHRSSSQTCTCSAARSPMSPDRPAVMSSTTCAWVVSLRFTSAATRPRYSAQMRSDTSNTSFMLWLMSTTPMPAFANLLTRSST